jgi:hypothetical protein
MERLQREAERLLGARVLELCGDLVAGSSISVWSVGTESGSVAGRPLAAATVSFTARGSISVVAGP